MMNEAVTKNGRELWLSRLSDSLTSIMAMAMGAASAVPVLIFALSLAPTVEANRLILWVLFSLLGGWLFGGLVHYLTRPSFDRILDHYVQSLDMVVLGDWRQRLDIAGLTAKNDEERMLRRLGEAVNRVLDRLQGIVTEISDAVSRVETDTQEILTAMGRQIDMANEQDAVVTETTATVNEVRATVTETAERAQSVAETVRSRLDISPHRNRSRNRGNGAGHGSSIRHRVEDTLQTISWCCLKHPANRRNYRHRQQSCRSILYARSMLR
ncbi:MAG: methyl-accepting chemotaxis protein [Anaerolineae bacterium]